MQPIACASSCPVKRKVETTFNLGLGLGGTIKMVPLNISAASSLCSCRGLARPEEDVTMVHPYFYLHQMATRWMTRWGRWNGQGGQDGRCDVLESRDAGQMNVHGIDDIDKIQDAK